MNSNTTENENINPAQVAAQAQKTLPELHLSDAAAEQLALILTHDFMLYEQYGQKPCLRLTITGKECHGFNYGVGFSEFHENDVSLELALPKLEENTPAMLTIVMDPFCAYYLSHATIDYTQDLANNQEGLVITNHQQRDFAGKFWRQDASKIPDLPVQ